MHLSTLWVSANKNWTFVCLALAKKKLQNQNPWKIDPRPSTPRPKVRLTCEIAKKKRPAKVTFYILKSWRGWQLKRLRIDRAGGFYFSRGFAAQSCSRENPHATQATNINNTRFEKQQTVTLLVTQSRQSQESSATPWWHTLSIFLTLPRREIVCSVCWWFLRQWEKIGCSFTVLFLCSVSIFNYPLLFYPSKFPAISYSGKF